MIRIILSIALIVGAYFVFTEFTDPTFASIDTLRQEAGRLDVALTKANELRAERAKLQSKFNLFSDEEKDRLAKLLPESIDNVRLIIDIDRIAAARNLRINNIAIQTGQVGGESRGSIPYGVATVSFSLTSNYDEYLPFLADLQKSLRLIDVHSITFQTSKETTESDFTTKVSTYWLTSGQAASTAGGAQAPKSPQ